MKSVIILVLCLAVVFAYRAEHIHAGEHEEPIEDNWMVVFFPQTPEYLREKHMQTLLSLISKNESIGNTWNIDEDFLGYHGRFESKNLDYIRSDPIVKHVEQDHVVRLSQSCTTQNNAVWNLYRVSNDPSSGGSNGPFPYNSAAGTGTFSYIIDTGILITHTDFGGRASSPSGANFIPGESASDCNGHGTHVAGTVGGTAYGYAKRTTLFGVKVLSCAGSGTSAGVNSGINWAANDGRSRGRCVLNLSLGGGFSSTQNAAINAAAATCFVAVAAGNDNANAANYSPASAACNGGKTWCVGATASTNARASFSNFGNCLTIFAPGQSITSDWIGNPLNSAINTISGTSMASPAVAGVGALLWSINPSWSADTLRTNLLALAKLNQVTNPGTGSPNRALQLLCP